MPKPEFLKRVHFVMNEGENKGDCTGAEMVKVLEDGDTPETVLGVQYDHQTDGVDAAGGDHEDNMRRLRRVALHDDDEFAQGTWHYRSECPYENGQADDEEDQDDEDADD